MDDQVWKRAVRGGYMLIKDSKTGKTVEQVDNKRLTNQYGSPMFQGGFPQCIIGASWSGILSDERLNYLPF